MNNGILELYTITLIVAAAYGGSPEPSIGIRRMCKTSMEVTCSLTSGNHEHWAIFINNSLGDLISMAKIDDRQSKCHVSATKIAKSAECICGTNYVKCTILDDRVADAGYLWLCGIYKHSSVHFCKPQFVEHEFFDECTTTRVTERVTEESITSFTTRDIGRTADTKEVLKESNENSKTENLTRTTIQYVEIVEKIERQASHDKSDLTQLALMISGPFVVFVIGLIILIFRKRLLSCFREKHDVARIHANQNTSADGNCNVGADLNYGDCSNRNKHSKERVTLRQPTTGPNVEQISVARYDGQQADIDNGQCIEDDPLYSRVQGNAILSADAGACGVTIHREECTPADAVYIDVDNIDAHYATVKRNRLPGNKQHKENSMFTTGANVTKFENDKTLNSKKMADIGKSASKRSLNSADNSAIPHSSCRSEDPLYSVVNKHDAIYSLARNVDPLYSTVNKKKQNYVTKQSSGAFDTVATKNDPLYSVVDKTKRENAWKITVPPAPLRSISTLPHYSKVNKKKKVLVDTDGATSKNY